MVLAQGPMASQRLLQQVSGEIAAAPPFLKGMKLEFIHYAPREGDVDALGAGGLRHIGTAGGWSRAIEPLLQLLNQILKKRHEIRAIFTR